MMCINCKDPAPYLIRTPITIETPGHVWERDFVSRKDPQPGICISCLVFEAEAILEGSEE